MQVYKKILVTIDCSDADGPILSHIKALAHQNDAEVVLLHVVHAHTIDQDRALREKALTAMEDCLPAIQADGIKARSVIRSGEPEEEIIKEIETGGYDLAAMATHGHTFIGDILFGSVSDSIKHKINIPLLLLNIRGKT